MLMLKLLQRYDILYDNNKRKETNIWKKTFIVPNHHR